MKELLKNISTLFVKNGFHCLDNAVDEKKFLYLYALYHYYNGDEDNLVEVEENCPYDKSIENFAQGFFEVDDFEGKSIDILIPYYLDNNENFDLSNVKYMLNQTESLVHQLSKKIYTGKGNTSRLKDILDDKVDNIFIKLITNYIPDYDEKNDIRDRISNISSYVDKVEFEIIFGDEIKKEVTRLTSDKDYVEEIIFDLDKPNNYLKYGDENSIICNISATSLKINYKKYGDVLLAKNLRFYVPNKKVDEGLEFSIREKGDNFWYFNNGIIVVCDDYKIESDKIKIKNGSVINGGQTTRMIGDIPFADDFIVSCKVIKNKYDDPVENTKFIADVAEASNTQKPIKPSDLIANRYEQRVIKQRLANAGIYMQIKRGESSAAKIKQNYPEPWQRTKNDDLAQLIYATIYQRPGTARNSKSTIFSDNKKYKMVFGNIDYNTDLIKDLLIIQSYYKKWRTKVVKSPYSDETKLGLTKNGFFYFAATITLIAKFAFLPNLSEELKTTNLNNDKGIYLISQKLFNHRIFNGNYAEMQNKIYDLFELVYDKYVYRAYDNLKSIKPDLVYSNFTKTDKNYITTIANNVYDDFAFEINQRVLGVIKPLFYSLEESDYENDSKLLSIAIESFTRKPEETTTVDLISEELNNELTSYRERICKEKNIKNDNVFTNKERNAIVLLKPKNVDDLYKMGCFISKQKTKTKLYGQDIIDIIKKVCKF